MKKLVLAVAISFVSFVVVSQSLTSGLDDMASAFRRDSVISIKSGDDDTKLMGRFKLFMSDYKVRNEFLTANPKIGRLQIGYNDKRFILIKDFIKLYDFDELNQKLEDSTYIMTYEFDYQVRYDDTTVAYGNESIMIYDSNHTYLKSFNIYFDVDFKKKKPVYNIQSITVHDDAFNKSVGLH